MGEVIRPRPPRVKPDPTEVRSALDKVKRERATVNDRRAAKKKVLDVLRRLGSAAVELASSIEIDALVEEALGAVKKKL